MPSKKELGRGVLSEAQQRHLFRKIVGFDLPAHARDFEGAYYHDYYQRERQYYLSHTGYCTLPLDEGMALLDRVEDVWKARGGGDDETWNYLRRRTLFVELTPRVGDSFPVGSLRVSFSDIGGRRESYRVILNPETGRIRFDASYKGK